MVSVVPLEPGLAATVELEVSNGDTAVALRSGDVEVLATPRLLALCEEATVEAIRGSLTDGATTVGLTVQFDHLRPTGVGGTVRAEASLDKVEGRKLIDCDPMFGNHLSKLVTWKGESKLGVKPGEAFRLRFHLRNAKLYSFEIR